MLPSHYKPQSPTEFIGPARERAAMIDRILEASIPTGAPIKLLMLGPPGVGKTTLANYLVSKLNADKWSITQLNGTQLKIELVEEIAKSLQFREMFGKYRVIRIEEVDKASIVAQVRTLTLLDELPDRTAVVCTSNCKIEDLEERFQTRFLALDIKGPTDDQLFDFLTSRFQIVKQAARQIATFACGNVRAALLDADAEVLAAR